MHAFYSIRRSRASSGQSGRGRLLAFRRLRRDDEGNTLVEVALVLPILMMVMMGIFSISMAFNSQIMLTQATGGGAAYLASLSNSSVADPCASTATFIKGAASNLTSASITVSITAGGTAYGSSCSVSNITPTAAAYPLGETVTVSTTYPCSLVIFGRNYFPSCTIPASSSQVIPPI